MLIKNCRVCGKTNYSFRQVIIMSQLFSQFLTNLQTSSFKLKEDFNKLEKLKNELKMVEERITVAQKDYDLNKAAELKFGIYTDIARDIEKVQNDIKARTMQTLNQILGS